MTHQYLRRYLSYVVIALAAAGATLLAVRARAAGVPQAEVLTYTGYLETEPGVPLEGKPAIAVSFLTSIDAEEAVCSAKLPSDTELIAGRFQLALPDKCATAVADNPDLYVEVEVDGQSLGRTKLGAVPYALEAAHATSADEAATALTATTATNATNATNATKAASATSAASSDVATALKAASVVLSQTCSYAQGVTDCTCPAGYAAIGGTGCTGIGCNGDGSAALVESNPVAANKWRISCQSGGVRVACTGPGVVCLKTQ